MFELESKRVRLTTTTTTTTTTMTKATTTIKRKSKYKFVPVHTSKRYGGEGIGGTNPLILNLDTGWR
jgi:hypothetical protein